MRVVIDCSVEEFDFLKEVLDVDRIHITEKSDMASWEKKKERRIELIKSNLDFNKSVYKNFLNIKSKGYSLKAKTFNRDIKDLEGRGFLKTIVNFGGSGTVTNIVKVIKE